MKTLFIVSVIIVVVFVSYIVIGNNKTMEILTITSPAFKDGGSIPSKYTCSGDNIIPPLQISGVPIASESLSLIVIDPDAPVEGGFVHWVVFNIPATTTEIVEGMEPEGVAGSGGSGKLMYIGPCPPSGEHRYFFKFYALDSELDLPEGADKAQLEKAMEGHIIASGELMGKYQKIN